MPRGSNLPAIGSYNRSVVLDAVRRSAGLSRTEVAEVTGLTAQTVGKVTRQLLEEGLLAETGVVVNGRGKPRTSLELASPGRLAVGVHVDPAVMTHVLLDLRGRVVARARVRTPSSSQPDVVVAEVAQGVRELVARAEVHDSQLLGVGIAVPGPVDVAAGAVLAPPNLPRWRHVPLRDALSGATGLPVALEKDVTAAAVAELWMNSSPQPRNLAYLYYGTGFGAGLVLGDEVVRGVGSNGGNIGHLTVDPAGPLCSCGRHGCLGTLVTPAALVREATDAGVRLDDGDPAAPEVQVDDLRRVEVQFQRLARRASSGDRAARDVLGRAAERIARAVVLLANLLDIDEVVLGGPFWQPVAEAVLADLPGLVAESRALISTHPVRFRSSEVAEDTAAVGAACVVLDTALSPRPSSLLITP